MTIDVPDEPIAVGRTADVFALDDDRVLKLLKPGFASDTIDTEADKTRAAHAAGVSAPAVLDVVQVGGRSGIVFERVHGDLLLDDIVLDAMRFREWAKVFAGAHVDVLSKSTADLPDIRDVLSHKIHSADLPRAKERTALSVLGAAPDGDAVLHGDFHPGNIIFTTGDPVTIDWPDAAKGHGGADIARTLWLISPATMSDAIPNKRVMTVIQGYFRKRYRKICSSRLKMDRRVIDAWRLPVVAARLSEGIEREEPALRAEVDRLTGG
ncbi:MAG: aminoglycoside phosphotransferase family protein [Acidimicrobiia bacterium]